MGTIVGIDLGTTNSAIAVVRNGRPEIIINADGNRITPSVVGVHGGEILVGLVAKNMLRTGSKELAESLVASVKRKMGTEIRIKLNNAEYSPQQISAMILRQLKEDAERYLGQPVDEAVISVPAYFNDAERQATKDAGLIAGLKVEKIINEPTAAALAYGLDNGEKEQKILVYDLGGGTFDVTVFHLYEGILDVLASVGDKYLGGDDFDNELVKYVAKNCMEQGLETTRAEAGELQKKIGLSQYYQLKEECEEAKKRLSFSQSTVVATSLRDKAGTVQVINMEINRATLESMIRDHIKRTGELVDKALESAHLAPSDIDIVLLVGGSTRIPLVETFLERKFGRKPRRDVNPDEAVALGAAIDAALKAGDLDESDSLIVMDVISTSLGTSCIGEYKGVLKSGIFAKIINAQSKIPCSGSDFFHTVHDNQTQVDLSIYAGESEFAEQNLLVKEFVVGGIPSAPAGEESIQLEYEVDVNAVLTATATVLSTGKKTSVSLKASEIRLSAEEIATSRDDLERKWADSQCSKKAKALLGMLERKLDEKIPSEARERILRYIDEVKAAQYDDVHLKQLDKEITDFLFDLDMGF